ncbi:MAG: hypothetical protein IPL35_12020 [Sphingobacteriales bacterium]|nr:hypothetical protein [Sphingobacteriales bacterium]
MPLLVVWQDFLVNITCYQVVNPDGDCICPAIYAPVCGGNGITYSNACEAECNGVFVYVEGECNINPANCTLIYGASDLPWLASAIGNIDTDCACGYSLQQYCYNEQTYFVLAPNPDAPCADVQTLIFDGNGTLVCTDGGIARATALEYYPTFIQPL